MSFLDQVPEGQIPFKIYYRVGPIYVGPPEEAPHLGVALIIQWDRDHGSELLSGDYYTWGDKGWLPCGYDSKAAYMNEPGFKKYLVGVQLYREDWNELCRIALADPDFPKKTAQSAREKRQRRTR